MGTTTTKISGRFATNATRKNALRLVDQTQTPKDAAEGRKIKLNFKLERVESLIGHTKQLLAKGADVRDGFDEPGLILASQFGAGVYLMSSMVGYEGDWTADLVFAEHCNKRTGLPFEEIAVAAYGDEETAELIPLPGVERSIAAAREAGHIVLIVSRKSNDLNVSDH